MAHDEAQAEDAETGGVPDGSRPKDGNPVAERSRASVPRLNDSFWGDLVLHFAKRDVSMRMTGAAAARVMAAHLRGSGDEFADDLHPNRSLMLGGWVTVDLAKVLATTWKPDDDAADRVVEALSRTAA